MSFTPIDRSSWPRSQVFTYFSRMAPTGYSLTVDVDVTRLRHTAKEAGFRFFPAYLWLVTRNLNRQQEFKIAEADGVLGYYDTLTPLYATFHEDTHTFSLMWTPYCESFAEFHAAYLENQRRFGDVRGLLSQPQTPPPPNAYTVSCIPWVTFSHFAVHSYDNKPFYVPSVEAGKVYAKGERLLMPLSLTCHHATTDGYHVHRFLEALGEDLAQPEALLL